MAANDPTFKNLYRIKDNTNNVIYQIRALSLKDAIQIALSGDVAGTVTTDFHENVTINAVIENGSVTHSKLATDSVQNDVIKDNEITKGKFNSSVYDEVNGTIADGTNSNLATKPQVKAYVESVISSEGHYKGVQSVATINTWTAANLHNGDRVITSSDPAGSGTGTLTLGNLPVVDGQEVIFYVSDDHSVKIWQSSEGNYKIKQASKSDPAASGTTLTAIDTISQNSNGEITATKKTIQSATTSQPGVVQLAGSIGSTVASENNKAASEKAVRDAINALDGNATSTDGTNVQFKVTTTDGIVSAVNITTDNTENKNNKTATIRGASIADDTKYPTEKAVRDAIDAIDAGSSEMGEVVAASLNDLDARLKAVEDSVAENNLGDRTADSFDTQVLKIGGEEVAPGTATPNAVGSFASAGTSGKYAREDHTHNVVVASGDSEGQVKVAGQNVTVNGWSAISGKAGSAIQGVKVNGTSLTPDSNKVVNIPAASTSAYGAVQFMTSSEAASLWANAWAAATA
jgi:hypothetical protein